MRMDTKVGTRAVLAASIVACLMATTPATAALNVDLGFLWQPESDNDTQIYLHVSNMAWEPSRSQVQKVYPKLRNPEWDYPMLVFMAHASKKSLQAVWELRADGMAWTAIMSRLKIPAERLIPEPRRKASPPRGVAHGYWAKHDRPVVTDDDVYYWVNVQMMSLYFGYTPVTAAGMREEGASFKAIAARSFRRGQGKAREHMKAKVETAGMEPATPPGRQVRNPRNQKKDN